MLDRAEERARDHLLSEAVRLGDDVQSALEPGGWIQRHPALAVAAAATLGAVAVPLALAVLRSPQKSLTAARYLLGRLGLGADPLGFDSMIARLRGTPLG